MMPAAYPAVAAVALVALVGQAAPKQPSPADVSKLTISEPSTVREIDAGDVRGVPTRLAWSPDGRYLYLRVSSFDRWSNETVRHVLVELQSRQPLGIPDEPGWLPRYWNLKAAVASPALPSWRIKVDSRDEQVRTTNVPREGNIGQATADPSAGLEEVVAKAAMATQKTRLEAYTLSGRTIASAVNDRVSPGRMFGWAPAPLALIAFANQKGRLVVMDARGHLREVKRTKDVSLPAWSDDGRRIAFVQLSGRNKFSVKMVSVN